VSAARRRRRDESDVVILEVIRLVTTDPWDARRAADALISKRHHPGAVLRARVRVLAALATAPSNVAERAAATLRETLNGSPT